MTKPQIDRQHQMTALLRRELAVAEAMRKLNDFRDSIGWKQDRTPAQKGMLSSIPPITAFMGMEG
ncbi:hypothetical protein [Shinella zoogloeoides]